MTVKIVTDSSADLSPELVREWGITVVPLYVRFGDKVYRDGIDITEDEFYQRLQTDPVHPNTTQPTPQDFTEVYKRLADEADGIISIHISSVLSGTCNSAVQAKETLDTVCPIEVIDSRSLTRALGSLAVLAARLAKEGKSREEILAEVNRAIPDSHVMALFDTLKYLLLGGRIGKARALLGSVLNVKPMLALKDGETVPAGQVRTRSKGLDRLVDFVKSATDVEDLSVIYSTTPDEARTLAERIGEFLPGIKVNMARLGPMLGVHMGPGALIVAIRGKINA